MNGLYLVCTADFLFSTNCSCQHCLDYNYQWFQKKTCLYFYDNFMSILILYICECKWEKSFIYYKGIFFVRIWSSFYLVDLKVSIY